MANNSKQNRAELKSKLKQKIDALVELNDQIDSVKMTGSYQDWYKKYSHIKREIEIVKNSKEMDMNKYQRLMREYRNIKSEKPVEIVELQEKKVKLQEEVVQMKAELKGKTVKKEEPNSQTLENQEEKKTGVIDAIQQLTELQVACSKIQTAQRLKALVGLISTVTEVVDVKLSEASKRFKNGKQEIKKIQEDFKARLDDISKVYQISMSGFEGKRQGLEQQYTDVLAKIAEKNTSIEFWKKRVSGKYYDKKGYMEWNAKRTKIDKAIKQLKSLKEMSKEQMAQYSKLLKQKSALDSRPEYANNPLIKMIIERDALVDESITIESQMDELEEQRNKSREGFIEDFANATEDRENKLAVIEKPGIVGRVIAGIADRFNAKKRFNDEVRTPLQHFVGRLGYVSKSLQERVEKYVGELNGEGKEKDGERASSRISDIIERGRKAKQGIIERAVSKDKEPRSIGKAQPALETGMEL